METSWLENSERLLGSGQNMWNVLMLSGANIVVELLKITLYIIAVVLDSIKPLTGTRFIFCFFNKKNCFGNKFCKKQIIKFYKKKKIKL